VWVWGVWGVVWRDAGVSSVYCAPNSQRLDIIDKLCIQSKNDLPTMISQAF
jgi:hypothetical protein